MLLKNQFGKYLGPTKQGKDTVRSNVVLFSTLFSVSCFTQLIF